MRHHPDNGANTLYNITGSILAYDCLCVPTRAYDRQCLPMLVLLTDDCRCVHVLPHAWFCLPMIAKGFRSVLILVHVRLCTHMIACASAWAQFERRLDRIARNLPAAFIDKSIGDLKTRCHLLHQAEGGLFEEGGRARRPL